MRGDDALRPAIEHRFRLMFQTHYGPIYNFAVRRVGSADDASDVVAEVFTTAWRRIDNIPLPPDDLLWLYVVARRAISDLRRGQSRRAGLVARLRTSREREVPLSRSEDPIHERLIAAMATLPADDCEALRLVLWEELSHAQAALVLDCTANAVAIRVHRAKTRLRRALPPETISEPMERTNLPIDPLRS